MAPVQADGAPVTVNALHPGVILTGLMRHALPPGTIQRFVFSKPPALPMIVHR